MKKRKVLSIIMAAALLMSGCGSSQSGADIGSHTSKSAKDSTGSAADAGSAGSDGSVDAGSANADSSVMAADSDIQTGLDVSDMFTKRDYKIDYEESGSAAITLLGSTASCDSNAVQVTGGTVTITDEGTYVLSGTLEDGMVIVDAEKTDKVQLVLDGVSIHSKTSAAVYVKQADKVFITMAKDSVNALSNGGQFTAIDDNKIDAVIFSKDDLTFNGNGSLAIDSPAGHGIVSKDDLVFTSGIYDITAAGHGISGRDSVRAVDGKFTVVSGKDGIHADNTDDTKKGFCYFAGGAYQLTAEGDGISASGAMQVDDGSFTILSGGGSENAAKSDSRGWGAAADNSASNDSVSTKGLKASGNLVLNGGSITADTADDAIHSNASLAVNGGTYEIACGDDGFHADAQLAVKDGRINITASYEGLEGACIAISGGMVQLSASDDGLNAAGGTDQSGTGGLREDDHFAANPNNYINISGGLLYIDASGDGIDSNGNLTVSGGEIYVSGPVDGGNGPLDYAGAAAVTGGIVIAAGSAGMAQNFGASSTQGTMLVTVGTQQAGSTITLTDSDGKELVSWQPGKKFESVVVSCPQITAGAEYTLSAGSYSTKVTMDSLVYGEGSDMGHPNGGNGGMGHPGGGRPGGMEWPKDTDGAGMPNDGGMRRPDDAENNGSSGNSI